MAVQERLRVGTLVFLVALGTRLVGVVLTTVTNLNTYAQADVIGYAAAAKYTAAGLRRGTYVHAPDLSSTFHSWAPFMAPFWLLPGPSRIYARIGVAVMGAYAIYNVYVITRELASREAALVAAAPLAFYPSYVFIHSTVLREVGILLGITTATRLLVVPPERLHPLVTYALAGGFLWMAVHLRPQNQLVFLALLALAGVLKYRSLLDRPSVRFLLPPVALLATVPAYSLAQSTIDMLADYRRRRAQGRTEVLGDVIPDTVVPTIAFSWITVAVFLFAPFPWQVHLLSDFVAMFEGLGNLVFFVAGVHGVRVLAKRNLTVAVTLAAGVVLGSVLYGLATPNIGTAVRMRQMVVWALFVLGGIGIADAVRLPFAQDTEQGTATPAD